MSKLDSIFIQLSLGDSLGLRKEDVKSKYILLRLGKLSFNKFCTVWMEHLSFENHLRRHVWEIIRESQSSFIKSSFKWSAFRPLEADTPSEKIIIDESSWNTKIRFCFLNDLNFYWSITFELLLDVKHSNFLIAHVFLDVLKYSNKKL